MKKFLIIVCIIAVIIFLGYIGKEMDLSNLKNTTGNNVTNSNVSTIKNTTANNTANNTGNQTNKVENNTTNTAENTTNQTSNTTNNTTQKQENIVEEVKLSDEDKAKELAKKTYGSSNGVYFKVEQVESNGVYIISVRDAETTNALEWYKVDVNNQTVK